LNRVVIDYTPAVRQLAGIGRIVRGQINSLIAQNPEFDYCLFVVGQATLAMRRQAPLHLHTTPLSERNMVRIWHRLNSPYPTVEWFTGGPIDLFHATDFVMAPSRARRKLLTVHDLAFRFFPDAAMPSLHHYLNVVVPRSVRRADHIIADSHHTARDLESEWNIPSIQISVVQGAVDHAHFHPHDDPVHNSSLRAKYKIPKDRPYILALSRLEPRKNYVRLIEAFHQARNEAALPHCLVIGGSKGWLFEAIFEKVQELNLTHDVLFPGFIKDADLPALYSAAEFFAYPSLYEGFGLPILEALACGTPVLTADNSCLPEAGGPGALYVSADSVDSIASGIIRLATEPALCTELRRAGLAHAANFTWQRSARQLRAAYAKVLD
jgi:glycosyltransferase involved in cell wall biosynthesis